MDVQFHGNFFRFVNTHLETASATVLELQARELIATLSTNSLPVVVAMDSNAQAFPLPEDAAYMDFIAAGYNDVWTKLFPLVLGFTCCQAQFVNNPVSQLYQRIDLVLTLGGIEAKNIALLGVHPSSRTPDGHWPSDHAGVAALLKVGTEEDDN